MGKIRLSKCNDVLKAGLRFSSKDWGSCGSCEQCHALEWETIRWDKLGQSFLSGKMRNHQKAEIHQGKKENPRGTCVSTQHISKKKRVAEWADEALPDPIVLI